MAYQTLSYAMADDVATITLDVPKRLNALSGALLTELAEAVTAAQAQARALVLTGAGRAFCSGADLQEAGTELGVGDLGARIDAYYNPLMRQLRDLRIPFVTAINGLSAGAGCSLALAGDLVLAADDASFILAFRHIGLVPDAGSTFLLTRAVGRVRAMELMLLGEPLDARQALAWGLINRVYPAAELAAAAQAMAAALARGPTAALGLIRKACWAALDNSFDAQLDAERDLQRAAGYTADHREGVAAFREKRPARFVGA